MWWAAGFLGFIKTVKIYLNTKPWVSKSLKDLLYKKKKAFREGNRVAQHNLQKEIKCEIRACKKQYKDKIESQLKTNNLGSVWDSMKYITGVKESTHKKIELSGYNTDLDLAQSLNDFFLQFDKQDNSGKHDELKKRFLSIPPPSPFFAQTM